MKFKNRILIIICICFCQAFTNIDGTSITLDQIRKSGNEKVLFIFSSGLSCHACYGWLGIKLAEVQQKVKIKIYVISDAKDNVFQRKMHSLNVKRMLTVELNETYIYDEPNNAFLKKYNAFNSPSILYFDGVKEQYFSYKMLFRLDGLNSKVIESLIM